MVSIGWVSTNGDHDGKPSSIIITCCRVLEAKGTILIKLKLTMSWWIYDLQHYLYIFPILIPIFDSKTKLFWLKCITYRIINSLKKLKIWKSFPILCLEFPSAIAMLKLMSWKCVKVKKWFTCYKALVPNNHWKTGEKKN